ncbi:hypothetical protein BD560DRAFT_476574 [Blakeslea trispora]|nr:hypothetical protein BD560DRAFT_476574 [Blakeslea trispora]
MTTMDISEKFIHCFNFMNEISRYDLMEVEHQVGNIGETQEQSLKKLLNLAVYETARNEENKKQQTKNSEPNEPTIESKSEAKVKGPYRSYAFEPIQGLLDFVIEQGLSARKAELIVEISKSTAQHYVRQYKEDNEKCLSGQKKQGAPSKKLEPGYTDFLCSYFDKKPEAVL